MIFDVTYEGPAGAAGEGRIVHDDLAPCVRVCALTLAEATEVLHCLLAAGIKTALLARSTGDGGTLWGRWTGGDPEEAWARLMPA